MKTAQQIISEAMADHKKNIAGLNDPEYDVFLKNMQARFKANTLNEEAIFQTVVGQSGLLFDIYLKNIPLSVMQVHNCRCCKNFVNRYGGLVVINEQGQQFSPMWCPDDAPRGLKTALRAVRDAVIRSKVSEVFYSRELVYGTPKTNPWTHLSVTPHYNRVHTSMAKEPNELTAAKTQAREGLFRLMGEWTINDLTRATVILDRDDVHGAEKVKEQASWLLTVFESYRGSKNGENTVWRAVALAPEGFLHPRSGMLGTLVEDIRSGLDIATTVKRFNEKMHPLKYMRPQAAPAVGNIVQANKLVEKMGIAGSLRRRFCKLSDISPLWLPTESRRKLPMTDGPFHLGLAKSSKPIRYQQSGSGTITMTWVKFRSKILPTADKIEIFVDMKYRNYGTMLTAYDINDPPILQWDTPEQRNPVSFYVYDGGSPPYQWGMGLASSYWRDVPAITLKPHQWYDESAYSHHGEGVFFVIEGAHETRQSGSALFPSFLRSELHEVRSTIEAYSDKNHPYGLGEPGNIAGLILAPKGRDDVQLRVTSNGIVQNYLIDRFD